MRYLNHGLRIEQPHVVFEGEIGSGLTVWLEEKGTGLRRKGDNWDALINSQWVCGYGGSRPRLKTTPAKITHKGRNAFRLAVPEYDRDAPEDLSARPLGSLGAAITKAATPPAPAPATTFAPVEKPKLSAADVAAVAARHTNGNGGGKPDTKGGVVAPPTALETRPVAAAIPMKPASERSLSDLKTLIGMVNETLQGNDDLIFGLSEDARQVRILRRKIVVEEMAI